MVLFSKHSFGGHKKEYYVYVFNNVDNSGRPLCCFECLQHYISATISG